MTNCIRTLVTFLILGISSMASARLDVTDDKFAYSVSVYQTELSSDRHSEMSGVDAFRLPMGGTVKTERLPNRDNTGTK